MTRFRTTEDLALNAAFVFLGESPHFRYFMDWLAERCYQNQTTIVANDPVQTYANEHLRELYLEVKNLVDNTEDIENGRIAESDPGI